MKSIKKVLKNLKLFTPFFSGIYCYDYRGYESRAIQTISIVLVFCFRKKVKESKKIDEDRTETINFLNLNVKAVANYLILLPLKPHNAAIVLCLAHNSLKNNSNYKLFKNAFVEAIRNYRSAMDQTISSQKEN